MFTGDSSWSLDPLAGLSGFCGRDLLPFLIEQAPIGIAVVRPYGGEPHTGDAPRSSEADGSRRSSGWRYVLANPAYCAIPGAAGTPIVGQGSLLGLAVSEVFSPAIAERIIGPLEEVRRTGETVQFQELEAALGPVGERTWWNVSAHPLFDETGQVAAVLILTYEVTDQVLARQRAEALAAEAENERQRLQAVMEALPVGVAITDVQGGSLHTNSAYERIWGGPRPDPDSISDYGAFKAWWVDTGQPVAPDEWASAQAVLKGATVVSQVMEIQRFDGSRAFILNSGAPVRDAAGRIVGSAVAIQDITPLRSAEVALESALAEAEEAVRTLDALMAYVPEGITIADAPDATIRMVSRYSQAILGRTHSGLTGKQVIGQWPVYRDDGQTPMVEEDLPLTRAVRHGEVIQNVELVQVNARGEPLHLLCNAAPIRDASGNILGGIVAWRDITEMRTTQDALRASDERYRTLFETMDEGLALHELLYDERGKPYDYRFLEANPAFERQTGLQAAQVLGRTVREVIPNIEPLWIERYAQVVTSGEPAHFESYSQALGRWYDVRAFRTQPGCFAALFVDTTAQREAREALRVANETLEQRVAERTALAEERAAQLRALAVELTRAEEQERRRLAGLLHDHLQQLLAAAVLQMHVAQPRAGQEALPALRQALDLLNEAIKASRSLTAELSPVILHDAGLVPALYWLGRWMNEHHGLQVTVEAPEAEIALAQAYEAKPSQARARPPLPEEIATLLFHSARELLFNVVKHAGVDRAMVQLSYPARDTIQLVVSDDGRGFAASDALDSSLGGFGLFSIRERLAYMGGQFTVEGEPGKGTRVTLRVPLESEAEAAAVPHPEPEKAERCAEPECHVPRKLRLVVVDDHAIVRKGLVGLLHAEPDLEVVGEAGDGLEAIARVRALEPDIVLMDLNMPRMDGIEATRRILAELPRVRVIVLSMFDDSEKKALMRQIGVAGYVAKGGDPASLLAAIRAASGREHSTDLS
jgi:PAS domain S-box-containing protein